GRAGRHAVVLGPAGRCGRVRRAAGLCVKSHRELDVDRRADLRAGRAVLPTGGAGTAAPRGLGVSLVEAQNLSCCFGSLRAVNAVSMSIEPGELRALIGANGAGKTTLFNLLSGFVVPSGGRIVFDGQDITGHAPHERVGMGIARTFQITEVFPELSV